MQVHLVILTYWHAKQLDIEPDLRLVHGPLLRSKFNHECTPMDTNGGFGIGDVLEIRVFSCAFVVVNAPARGLHLCPVQVMGSPKLNTHSRFCWF